MAYNNLYWGTLINSDEKKPSPLLEQLCLGVAKIIAGLEPGTELEGKLTPSRIAAFYRSVGGDYDSLFLRNAGSLSFIYKTLGCYHSIQPVANAFDYPNVPTLDPAGYVRWQTIQLQLTPAEHVPFLQRAVSLYDVPKPEGGIFPKYIPTEAFPAQPDEEMVRWWKHVTGVLEQNHIYRLGSSPYRSPSSKGEGRNESRGEYFQQNGRLSTASRPSRTPRTNSEEETWQAATRRRSSVPELPTPPPISGDGQRRPGSAGKHPRSKSAQRISNRPYLPSSSNPHKPSNSSHRNSGTTSPYRSMSKYDSNEHRRHRSSGAHSHSRQRPRSPSIIHESTGSEASSEDSRAGREKSRRDDRRKSSLWPPPFLNHLRRHSHDATYEVAERKPPLPPRPAPIQTQAPRVDPIQSPTSARSRGYSNNVRFRNDIFTAHDPNNPAQDASVAPDAPNQMPVPRMRYEPPAPPPQNPHLLQGIPLSRAVSGENTGMEHEGQRRFGAPMRVNTVTGVGGRRYAHGEPRSAGGSRRSAVRDTRTMSAAPMGLSSSG